MVKVNKQRLQGGATGTVGGWESAEVGGIPHVTRTSSPRVSLGIRASRDSERVNNAIDIPQAKQKTQNKQGGSGFQITGEEKFLFLNTSTS